MQNGQSGEECAYPEENLLMYLHGALPPTARFRAGRHLRHCPSCRRRLAVLAATSQALADSIRGDALTRWVPPTVPSPKILPASRVTLLLVGIALLTATTSFWMTQVKAVSPTGPTVPRSEYLMPKQCPLSGAEATAEQAFPAGVSPLAKDRVKSSATPDATTAPKANTPERDKSAETGTADNSHCE